MAGHELTMDVPRSSRPSAMNGKAARLASFAKQTVVVTVTCPSRPIQRAVLCDARERPLRELDVREGRVIVPMPLALARVLVWF